MPFGRRSRQRALTSRQWIWCSVLLTLSMCHPLSAFLQPVHLWPAVVVLPRRSTPWEISRQFIHTERSVTMQDDEWMRANLDTTAEPWLKNQVLKRRGRKVLAGIISIVSFLIMCTIYRSAVTSLILQPFRQSALIVNYKVIKRFVLVLWLLMASTHTFRVSRRQAVDATSEWGRYARNPGARGRALTWLLMRVLIVFFISKIAFKEGLLRYSGSMFSNGLLKIGPLYIKLGQIISCREDVLPEPWIKSMEKLQDQVPAKSGNNALELAYTAWETVCKDKNAKEDFHATFEEFDTTPIAAASLGQVHRAKLRSSGREVAIKLQRQYLRQIYDQDLALLEKVAEAVDNFRGRFKNVGGVSQSWRDIFKDAETILYREIDYRSEAENGSRFCQDFGIALGGKPSRDITTRSQDGEVLPSASSWLRAPYVYKDYCAEKVLVMEYVPSVKITDTVKLEEASVTLEDREYLADMLGRSYLRQFCCHLFFSTDPHPGNLGVEILNTMATTPSERVRLVFYDFGQAATLTTNQAEGILMIIDAIVEMDVDRSIEAFQQMGVLKEGAVLAKVRAKVADNYKTGKIKTNRKRIKKRQQERGQTRDTDDRLVEIATVPESLSNETTKDAEVLGYFTLPAEYAFVGRALSQMGGVGKSLDPDFDFISSAAPWVYEVKGVNRYLREETEKRINNFLAQVKECINSMADAVDSMVDTIKKVR